MGWVRGEERELLTQGFLESFWDDEIVWFLTSGGKFLRYLPGSWFRSHKSLAMQESPNAANADVMPLFNTIYMQFPCKVL